MDDWARSPHDICGPVAEIPILTEVQQGRTSMPLWHIYCPETAYSAEDKCAFATRITDLYSEVGPGSMSALPFTSCRRTRSLSVESQRTISSGSGLIILHAVLRPSGDNGGWKRSTICSIP